MLMPRDGFEFRVLLRKEYERGVEDAAQKALLATGSYALASNIRQTLLSRTTVTQKSWGLMGALSSALCDGYHVNLYPSTSGRKDELIVSLRSVFSYTEYSCVESIFKVQESIEELRDKFLSKTTAGKL